MTRRNICGPSHPLSARRSTPLPAQRAALWLILTALAALALSGTASASVHALPWPDASAVGTTGAIADAEVFSLRAAVQQEPGFWGGPVTAGTGETLTVYASVTYPEDPARTQAWADFFASLDHGPELSTLVAYIAPLDEVQRVCGREALACYSSRDQSIYAPGDPPDADTSAESVIAHEYGHHVAANRDNAPWDAVDWGTKRWATYLQVCSRQKAGQFYPGDERRFYTLNPGEGFAEAYRVLNEQRLGLPTIPWSVVDALLAPDAQALALVQQDVEQPWAAAAATAVTGRVAKLGARSTKTVATPLDGAVAVTLRPPAKTRLQLELLDPATLRVVARAAASAPYSATLRTTACGQRSLLARVTSLKGAGTYRLNVSRP